jgi:RNA polymerase sigma factor (sigma-70 family)
MAIDPAAIEAYENHADDLIAYATVLVGPSEAEDVVADALLRVFTSAHWSRVREPRGYLFRCVLHQAASHRRRRSVGRAKELQAAGSQAAHTPSSASRLDELGALEALSVRERAVIYLTYWEDLAPGTVGAALGISEGAVRRYLARARAKLREVISHA